VYVFLFYKKWLIEVYEKKGREKRKKNVFLFYLKYK